VCEKIEVKLPHRAILLQDKLDPISKKLRIDRLLPILTVENMLNMLPELVTPLKLIVEPKLAKFNTDRLLPSRT
jgi:hypothetical protein